MPLIFALIIANILFLKNSLAKDEASEWLKVEMPKFSYFAGFSAPTDQTRWNQARLDAAAGTMILLRKVLDQIVYPGEVISGDINFGWLHRMADVFSAEGSDKNLPLSEVLKDISVGQRAALTMIGFGAFDNSPEDFEGTPRRGFYGHTMFPAQLIQKYTLKKFTLPRPIVGIGFMNENWGWLSTHFLNRTCGWGYHLTEDLRHSGNSATQQMLPFLDDPNLVMLLVNQHHNVRISYITLDYTHIIVI